MVGHLALSFIPEQIKIRNDLEEDQNILFTLPNNHSLETPNTS